MKLERWREWILLLIVHVVAAPSDRSGHRMLRFADRVFRILEWFAITLIVMIAAMITHSVTLRVSSSLMLVLIWTVIVTKSSRLLAFEESGESTRLIGFSLKIVLVLVASLLCMNQLDGIVADILVAASPDLPHCRI